jgi:twitching motility protein PilT
MAIITPSNPEAGATDADPQARERLPIDRLFEALVRYSGSDLHLKVGRSPLIRVRGELHPLKAPPIDGEEMKRLVDPLLDNRTRGIFEREGGADFSYLCVVEGTPTRFRINVLSQQGYPGLVARRISTSIPDFSGLHLPPVMQTLCGFDQGLILLAGVTGSGKSTTIASMLDWINHNYRKHILTLEDPVEFVFTEDKCLINQREIGQDVKDFGIGIKQAVREDPDIMLVGEMRDEETFLAAVQAAETGHLVFGTIHAPDAPGTITRILELFPPSMHASLRGALASNMKAIVAQKLLPSIKQGVSRVPTVEILIFNSVAKKLVREGEDEKIADFIRMSSRDGMQDFTASLKSLVDGGLIDVDTAIEVAPNREALRMALRGINVSQGGLLG